jgi:rhamnose transport system substrate-binding protein
MCALSSNPDAANQNAWLASLQEYLATPEFSNIKLLEIGYTDDTAEGGYDQALSMIGKYPEMDLFMVPHSIAIVSACKALQDEKLTDKIKVSGLGLASEMETYCLAGISPEFALWSFYDLGYLAYQLTYKMLTKEIKGAEGETFTAGRLGEYTITADPVRGKGLRLLLGPFKIYNKDNVSVDAKIEQEAAGM